MVPIFFTLELTTNEHGLIGDGVPSWNAAKNTHTHAFTYNHNIINNRDKVRTTLWSIYRCAVA